MIRLWLLLSVIASSIGKLNAAALKSSENVDLNRTIVSDDAHLASTYGQEHLSMNDSKVIIDLYTPTSRPINNSKSNDEHSEESAIKKVSPLVQLVINKPSAIEGGDSTTATSASSTSISTTTTVTEEIPTTQSSMKPQTNTPLIPPATVNASIKQLSNNSTIQKQGQIIIRFAFFSSSKIIYINSIVRSAIRFCHSFVHEHVSVVKLC